MHVTRIEDSKYAKVQSNPATFAGGGKGRQSKDRHFMQHCMEMVIRENEAKMLLEEKLDQPAGISWSFALVLVESQVETTLSTSQFQIIFKYRFIYS